MPKMTVERSVEIRKALKHWVEPDRVKKFALEVLDGFDALLDEREKLMTTLEDMTPGGSEFVGDPFSCLEHLKGRGRTPIEQAKTIKALREANEGLEKALREIVGEVKSTTGFLRRMPKHSGVDECRSSMERSEVLADAVLTPKGET